jgi:hypothetical protein
MRIKFTHAVHDRHIEEVAGPKFHNGCGHWDSEYIGTVKTLRTDGLQPMGLVDVYVHEGDIGRAIAHVCIRYGDEGGEYCSPGTVLDFLASAARNERIAYYPEVAALLLEKLDFFCEIKERK